MALRQLKALNYGDGSVYQRKSDGRWIATVEAGYTRKGTRRRPCVTAKTEREVRRKLVELQRKIKTDGVPAETSRITVKAWAEQWLAITEHKLAPKTHGTDKSAIAGWVIPTIGHKRLEHLNPGDVRTVVNAMRDARMSTSTMHRYQGVLMRLLKAAIQEGYDVPQRVLGVDAPSIGANDRVALSVPESLSVLKVASDLPHGSRWALALLQGMRKGECLGLTWSAVDLERGSLTISWQLQALPYLNKHDRSKGFRVPDGYEALRLVGAEHLVRPKSKAGWRVIPLVPWAAQALETWRDIAPTSEHDLVWPRLDGRPASRPDDTLEWKAIQDQAGVRHPSGRYYHGHELRHSCATLLMSLGVADSVRIAIMGHSSIAVTHGYEHVDVTQARLALESVAGRLGLTASVA